MLHSALCSAPPVYMDICLVHVESRVPLPRDGFTQSHLAPRLAHPIHAVHESPLLGTIQYALSISCFCTKPRCLVGPITYPQSRVNGASIAPDMGKLQRPGVYPLMRSRGRQRYNQRRLPDSVFKDLYLDS